MKLVINVNSSRHVSVDTINEFENEILTDADVKPIIKNGKFIAFFIYALYKFSEKTSLVIYKHIQQLFKRFLKLSNHHYFVILMGLEIKKCLPYFFFPIKRKSIYLFDAWPNSHNQIKYFADFFNIDFVFVSSSLTCESLKLKLKKSKVYWIPEGINPKEYRFYPYKEKDIDVLALGRKYETYHLLIIDYLKEINKVYLYEKLQGEIIFPTREGLINGLGRSKISICVPSSITHPIRSGDIQTMTIRYLQSMVSKCLVVGHAPPEMVKLFGYNPVVEIDMKNSKEQLTSILANYNDFIPLIEKNYQMVIQNHTWKCRWAQIRGILDD